MMNRLRRWAAAIKRDVVVLFLAVRDRRVGWLARGLMVLILAYALSPIDLIPDFIPVLGYLDDLILLPVAVYFVVRLLPDPMLAELRVAAAGRGAGLPRSRMGAVLIVGAWLLLAGAALWWIWWD